jgi:hypothetical protein
VNRIVSVFVKVFVEPVGLKPILSLYLPGFIFCGQLQLEAEPSGSRKGRGAPGDHSAAESQRDRHSPGARARHCKRQLSMALPDLELLRRDDAQSSEGRLLNAAAARLGANRLVGRWRVIVPPVPPVPPPVAGGLTVMTRFPSPVFPAPSVVESFAS